MYDPIRPPDAAANHDACLAALAGVPVIAAWGMGVDSTAMICGEPISSYDAGGCRRHLTAVENH